ncbi:MAG: hypothetical protein ACRBK7_14725 [Acidimicrobiales bacterium]
MKPVIQLAIQPVMEREAPRRSRLAHKFWAFGIVAALALLATACGDDGETGPTIERQLSDIEGRPMGSEEIAERLAVGETLCQMDDSVLDAIWFKLDDEQLRFQDLVFGRLCPERSVFYAGKTGRYVTDEATESGVVTSTSRPPATTSTTAPSTVAPTTSTSTRGSIGPSVPTSALTGSATSETVESNAETSTSGPSSTSTTVTLPPLTASTQSGEGG